MIPDDHLRMGLHEFDEPDEHAATVAANWYARLRSERSQMCLTCRHSEDVAGSHLNRWCWVDAGEEDFPVMVAVRHRCEQWKGEV